MFRPLILEHFWDTRGTLWDMSRDTLGHVLEHLGTCLGTPAGHFGTCLGHFGTCLGTLWDMSWDMSQNTQYFDRIFEMHEFGMVGGPKYYFFNILIQSNIPEQYGPVGTRIEQYGFSSSSDVNWMTLRVAAYI